MKRHMRYYMAELNPEYILYIKYSFGLYYVCVMNAEGTTDYSVYGGYKTLGAAENRLLKSASTYHSNPVKYRGGSAEEIREGKFWRKILDKAVI